MKGKVTFFKDFNGYGFATGEDNIDYFVHVSEIRSTGFRTLYEGQEIEFTPSKNYKGPIAREVIPVISTSAEKELPPNSVITDTIIKDNPFTPQDPITDPNKFVGRKDSLINAIDALYNGRNILIDGHRGIGKSSLALQLLYVTQGEPQLLDRFGIDLGNFEFNHITGDHRCVPGNNLIDIANGLISTLRLNLNRFSETKKIEKSLSQS